MQIESIKLSSGNRHEMKGMQLICTHHEQANLGETFKISHNDQDYFFTVAIIEVQPTGKIIYKLRQDGYRTMDKIAGDIDLTDLIGDYLSEVTYEEKKTVARERGYC